MSVELQHSSLSVYPISDTSNELLTRSERRALRRQDRGEHYTRKMITRAIGATGLAATFLYGMDISHGQDSLANSHSSIVPVSSASSSTDASRAIVDSAGWGNLNAYDTAAALPTLAHDGNVWAIKYDNLGINTDKIAQQLVEKAHSDGIEELAFDGHSMGGLVDLEIARKIYEGDNHISIPYIVLDCTPANIDSVRPDVRDNGFNMTQLLNYVPGARLSSAFRLLGEEVARFDQFRDFNSPLLIDPASFVRTTKHVIESKFMSGEMASTSLLDSQFKFIVASGARNNILALGKNNGKPKPILVYMRPQDANADLTVDNDHSQRAFEKYAKEAGLKLIVVQIPGIGHANPIERPGLYNAAMIGSVLPKIYAEKEREQQVLASRLDASLPEQSSGGTLALSHQAQGQK